MALRPKPLSPLSSLQTKLHAKNPHFSNPPPKLRIWKQEQEEVADDEDADPSQLQSGVRALKLSHPLLRILESFGGTLKQFDQIHAQLLLSGLFQHPLAAGRVIKNLCHSPSSLPRAVTLFSYLEYPDAFIANTILRSVLASQGPKSALHVYQCQILQKGVKPNHYSFPLLAKMCAKLNLIRQGEKMHGLSIKFGLESNLFIQNSLIHMYFSFGTVESARMIFHGRFEEDSVTWNSMVDGYAKNGMVDCAREMFDEMPDRDLVSWNAMVAGYVGIGDMDNAEEIFVAMPLRDIVSWNSLIDGHAKADKVEVAREIFDRMPARNVVSWNTMLALYTRLKNYDECLKLFDRMMDSKEAKPNEATLVSVLTSCANLGTLERGKWVHSYIIDNKKIEPDVLLLTTLLTMYAKCGDMDAAREIFYEIPGKNVVSWNSLIMGYAMQGKSEDALQVFIEMEKKGSRPNDVTFICVLCACTHAGMVLEGWWYFDLMRRVYNIEPKADHYGCMVDLLSRAGLLKDSKELIEKMPMEPPPALWGALLSACRTHSNSELGEIVGKRLIELEPRDVGPYVLLSNIYAAEGKWNDVEKVRTIMKEKGLQKTTGFSSVDLSGADSEHIVEDNLGHKKRMVYSMLKEMGTMMKSSCSHFDGNIINNALS